MPLPTPSPRPTAEDRIRAATWFAGREFGVFSVWSADPDGTCRCARRAACASPGKHPIGRQGFLEHTRDPERIRTLLSAASEPNYGLVPPDGVLVLDVDGDGVGRLAELEARYGPLPPTLRTDTAHGQHVFVRWPEGLPRPAGQLFGFVTRWASGPGAGYVIGPRSVHASGGVYAPAGPCTDIAEMPPAWVAAAAAPAAEEDGAIEVGLGGYELPQPGYAGARYEAIRDYAASRYRRGMSKVEVWAGVRDVLAPCFANPLTERELRDRFERAWRGTAERLGDPMADPVADAEIMAAAAVAPSEPAAGWPEPPDDAAYHGPLGEIVRAVAPHTEADPVGILGTLLASIGACLGNLRYIYQGSAQAPNLFVVLVGDSSTGRKGTAGSIARDVMSRAYPAWASLIVAGLGSGEGLVSRLTPSETERERPSEPRALVMESEFGRLLTVMGREGSTLSPIVRDAWDGVPMGRALAREQSIVYSHHVGIVGHVTPVELRTRLSGTDMANGFGNRFIWLAVRRARLVPFPTSPVELVDPAIVADVGAAIRAAGAPGEVPWSPGARDAWEELYLELALRRRYGLWGAMTARTEAQVVRLALVYALLDRSAVIDVPHLRAARALWDYAERSVLHVFGDSTGDRHADVLRTQLADGPLKWEDAKRSLGVRSAAELETAVALLESLGIAGRAKVRVPGSKRPATVLRLAGRTTTTTTTALAPAHETGA